MSDIKESTKPLDHKELVVTKVSEEIELLQERKAAALLANGQNQAYVKDRVFKHRKIWWNKWKEMMESDDPLMVRSAMVEYNKLQTKVLPHQLEGSGGQSVTVNILGMGIEQSEEPIEGELVQ